MKAGCDVDAVEASGLNGVELAKENMRIGWERVVDYIRDTQAAAGKSDQMTTSKDMEQERQIVAARNRRMQRIVGKTTSNDAMQILLSSEKLDKLNSPNVTPRAADNSVEKPGSVKHAALSHTATSVKLAEAEVSNDKLATQQYLQLWDATEDVLLPIQDWIARATKAEPPVTKILLSIAAKCGGRLSGLEYRLKSESSIARKVLDKTNGDASQFESFCAKQNDWLRYTMILDTDKYVDGVVATGAALAKKGIKESKMKNFWRKTGEETDYMGINAIYHTKQGFPIELQFHTQETLDTKMQRW